MLSKDDYIILFSSWDCYIWDPSGQPAYGTPAEPGCTPHMGPIWVAHMGPI